MKRILVSAIVIGSTAGLQGTEQAITQALIDDINSKQTSWTAGVSSRFEDATVRDIKQLCGTIMKDDPRYNNSLEEKSADNAWVDDIPSEFDVRKQWPKCASVSGDIRDQSSCGSCWAFGSTEAFNDRRCIATGDTTILSTEDTTANCGLLSCMSMGCNGGQPGNAWKWFTTKGVVTGGGYDDIGKGDTCAPYALKPCAHHVNASAKYPKCPSAEGPTPSGFSKCPESKYKTEYSTDKKKASSAYNLGSVKAIQQDMVQYGSATAAFTVYADFPSYKSGVYHHTTGSALGGHAIRLLGWGTEGGEDYWIVANSWNVEWGDQGTFKIRRGTNECGIEGQVSAGKVDATQQGEEPAITHALVEEINSKQSSWTAHMSPRFEGATVSEIKRHCGTIMKGDSRYNNTLDDKSSDDAWVDDIPSEFDVRKQWPKCASVSGVIRDQSSCGSCWAFGSTEAFNDRRCIATGDTSILSTEDTTANCGLLSCMSMGCNGGQPGNAWKWFTSKGVVTGGGYDDIGKGDTCAPYALKPCAHHVNASAKYPKCPSAEGPTPSGFSKCPESKYKTEYSTDKKKASSAYNLGSVTAIQQDMVQYGSATAAFTVYADFPSYKSGVYHHITGSALGGHAIRILGWGTEGDEDYWIVANSWNVEWGDQGTFKIRRGTNECGIENQVSAGKAAATEAFVV